LSDFRLAGVRGLASDMLGVRWKGAGNEAQLEIFQRAKDGTEKAPTADEQRSRKDLFEAALLAAGRKIPRCTLPPSPPSHKFFTKSQESETPSLPEPKAAAKPVVSKAMSVAQRNAALLSRVRARAAASHSVESKEYDELRRKIVICDNAMAAHSVLQSLFARAEGKFSAASEAELLSALCSSSFGMQAVRTLSRDAAKEAAQALVATAAAGWFSVEVGVHNPDLKVYRRMLKGSAAGGFAALQAERSDLDKQLRGLCELAKRREQELASQPMLELEAEAHPAITDMAATKASPAIVDHLTHASGQMGEKPQPLVVGRRLRRKTQIDSND